MFPTLVWKLQLRAELHETMDARILALLESVRRELPALVPGRGPIELRNRGIGFSFRIETSRQTSR